MENTNKDCHGTENSEENVNFQMYFRMVKSNEIPWKLFIESMKYSISLLDLKKSKKLIFDLLEEIKGFIEREAEYQDKQNTLKAANTTKVLISDQKSDTKFCLTLVSDDMVEFWCFPCS